MTSSAVVKKNASGGGDGSKEDAPPFKATVEGVCMRAFSGALDKNSDDAKCPQDIQKWAEVVRKEFDKHGCSCDECGDTEATTSPLMDRIITHVSSVRGQIVVPKDLDSYLTEQNGLEVPEDAALEVAKDRPLPPLSKSPLFGRSSPATKEAKKKSKKKKVEPEEPAPEPDPEKETTGEAVCEATKRSGERCSFPAILNSSYCGMHQPRRKRSAPEEEDSSFVEEEQPPPPKKKTRKIAEKPPAAEVEHVAQPVAEPVAEPMKQVEPVTVPKDAQKKPEGAPEKQNESENPSLVNGGVLNVSEEYEKSRRLIEEVTEDLGADKIATFELEPIPWALFPHINVLRALLGQRAFVKLSNNLIDVDRFAKRVAEYRAGATEATGGVDGVLPSVSIDPVPLPLYFRAKKFTKMLGFY